MQHPRQELWRDQVVLECDLFDETLLLPTFSLKEVLLKSLRIAVVQSRYGVSCSHYHFRFLFS